MRACPIVASVLAAALLAGCGGGSSGDTKSSTTSSTPAKTTPTTPTTTTAAALSKEERGRYAKCAVEWNASLPDAGKTTAQGKVVAEAKKSKGGKAIIAIYKGSRRAARADRCIVAIRAGQRYSIPFSPVKGKKRWTSSCLLVGQSEHKTGLCVKGRYRPPDAIDVVVRADGKITLPD